MIKTNFHKAERLLPLRRQIDEVARSVYLADKNHQGSACKPSFDSSHLRDAHHYLRQALDSIDLELQSL